MSTIKLHFQDSNGRSLADLDVSSDIPIVEMMPFLLEELGLEKRADWQLVLVETNQIIDLQETFMALGLRDGSVIQLRSGQELLGRYEIRRKIDEGGMGVVYEGYDPNLGRQVAIKVIKKDIADNTQMMQRFAREARSVARLGSHPGIVAVYDFNHDNPQYPFFVMEYVEGMPLDDLISQRNGLALDEAALILQRVADALDAAHKQGIIHRDIKPSNILMQADDEQKWAPKLMDFGLVKISEEASDLTQTGTVMGSPHYMSPEQIDGKPLTAQSDIYSLGIVVYEMLTGRRPFQGSTSTRILLDHIRTPPPPPRQFRDDMPPQVEEVVLKALEKDPNKRYKSAESFARDFLAAIKVPETKKPSLPSPKTIAAVVAGMTTICILAVVLVWAVFFRPPSVNALFRDFDQYLETRQYREAERVLEEILARQAGNELAVDNLLVLANELEANEEYDASIRVYRKLWLEHDPGNQEALAGLHQAYLQRAQKALLAEDLAAAENDFTAVLDLDNSNFAANLGMGDVRYRQGRYEESISYYLASLTTNNSAVEARTGLAWAYFHTDQFEKAIPEFAGLGNSNPLESFKGLGLSYIGLEWYEDALPPLRRWSEMEPTLPTPYKHLGLTYEYLNNFENAAIYFRRWVQLERDTSESQRALSKLGWTLFSLEQYEEAVTTFAELIALNPRLPGAYEGLGRSYRAQGDSIKALQAFQEWIKLSPESADAYSLVAWAALDMDDVILSIESYKRALELEERFNWYIDLGRALTRNQQLEEAAQAYERSVELNPDQTEAYRLAGWLFLRHFENFNQAISMFEEARTIAEQRGLVSSDASILEGLGRSYRAINAHDNALQAFYKWADLTPGNVNAVRLIAWSYFDMKQYENAVQSFTLALEIEERAEFYWGRGSSYRGLLNCNQAISDFERVLDMEPEHQNAANAIINCQQ